MDPQSQTGTPDPLVVTGTGHSLSGRDATSGSGDVTPWIKSRKTLKFMGKQDKLAVQAAGLALQTARVDETVLKRRTGLYVAVGFIPFEKEDIDPLAENSSDQGRFSMELFSTKAMPQVNPLLTFRCLSNMPAFHVSINFGMQGPYFVTYPGAGQFYVALQEAEDALSRGDIDVALVGAVADQDNFLVKYHLNRLGSLCFENPRDAAAFLVLEKRSPAVARGVTPVAEWNHLDASYQAPDLLSRIPRPSETLTFNREPLPLHQDGFLGPAAFAYWLDQLHTQKRRGELLHEIGTFDGIHAASAWRLL